MGFQVIQKRSAPEMVAEQIIKKINTGEIQPGGRLPSQRDLAQLFDVGRSSVREATNALAVMGYIDIYQGKGTFVRQNLPDCDPSFSQLSSAIQRGPLLDLMAPRELLECRAAELAALRKDRSHIDHLYDILAEMETHIRDYDRFLTSDIKLHMAIAEASENRVIYQLIKMLMEKVLEHHRALNTGLLSRFYLNTSFSTAKKIVSAIERQDGKAAIEHMHDHLNAIRTELKKIV